MERVTFEFFLNFKSNLEGCKKKIAHLSCIVKICHETCDFFYFKNVFSQVSLVTSDFLVLWKISFYYFIFKLLLFLNYDL